MYPVTDSKKYALFVIVAMLSGFFVHPFFLNFIGLFAGPTALFLEPIIIGAIIMIILRYKSMNSADQKLLDLFGWYGLWFLGGVTAGFLLLVKKFADIAPAPVSLSILISVAAVMNIFVVPIFAYAKIKGLIGRQDDAQEK